MAQDGCGSEGGARGNRKRRPRSVSPLLELGSLKVCFHFQNESEGGEVSPSLPGCPLCRTQTHAHPGACGRAGSEAVAGLAVEQWQGWQSSLQPSWLLNLFLCPCGAGAGLLTLPQFPIRHAEPAAAEAAGSGCEFAALTGAQACV